MMESAILERLLYVSISSAELDKHQFLYLMGIPGYHEQKVENIEREKPDLDFLD